MPRPLVYLIYNLLLPLALLLGFPSFLVKGFRRGGLARNFRQRFGHFREGTLPADSSHRPIWIHAVSVGEVLLALKAIEALRAAAPERPLVLSTTTTTGFAVAEEHASDSLTVIHNPFDLPWVVATVVRRINPCAFVLIESEIWPNLLARLRRNGIPALLVNARLSPRSARRYRRLRSLVSPIFEQLDAVSVPFESDVERWAAIGVPRDRIEVLGSVKFDSTTSSGAGVESDLRQWLARTGCPESARILLGGSTHEGEETLLARRYLDLRDSFPDLRLVLVPRHAERGSSVAARLRELGLRPVPRVGDNRAETRSAGREIDTSSDIVWIANTTGELRSWFALAEVVVIGKSFRGIGGQNPVEPILAGRPVVVGPHMENFADVVRDLSDHRGIEQLEDESDLGDALHRFLASPEKGRAMAGRGRSAMARHEGAAERTARFILAHVDGGTGVREIDRSPANEP